SSDLAAPGSHYTRRVVDTAVRLVVEDGLPYRSAEWALWRDHRVFVPYATIQNWVEAGGEKGGAADRDRAPRLGAGRLLPLHRRRRAVGRTVLRPVARRQPHLQAAHLPGPCPRPHPRPDHGLLPPLPAVARGPRADRQGDHDRRIGAVSRADRRGLRCDPAPT